MRIANTDSFVSAILLAVNETTPGNDLTAAKLTRIRTLSRFDPQILPTRKITERRIWIYRREPREVYFVDRKVTENRLVEFELVSL